MRRHLVVLALASFAQSQAATAQQLDRTKRPVITADSPFVFPKMETQQLANGLRVVVIANHSVPLVSVRAFVAVDSLDDPVGKEGLYVLTAGMLHEGTATRTGAQVASDIAMLGNSVTSSRFTTTPANLAASLEIMADLLMHPTFPDSALARLKTTLASRKQIELQSPATVPYRVFLKQLYGTTNPFSRIGLASAATMETIGRDDLVRFHSAYYRPNNTTLIVVGDVHATDVVALATKAFGSWERAQVPEALSRTAHGRPRTTLYLADRPGALQSYVFVGALGPARTSGDSEALDIVATVLGASGGGRVYDALHERRRYMYSGTPVAMTWRPAPSPSTIGGSAAIATTKTDSALIQWMAEIRRTAQEPPTSEEMARARAALVDALPAGVETDDLVANRLMSMLQTGVPLDFYNSYRDRVLAVKPDAVREAAAKYLDSSHLVIVVAGDRKTIEPLLRAANIAPIVLVDDPSK